MAIPGTLQQRFVSKGANLAWAMRGLAQRAEPRRRDPRALTAAPMYVRRTRALRRLATAKPLQVVPGYGGPRAGVPLQDPRSPSSHPYLHDLHLSEPEPEPAPRPGILYS